MNGDNGGADGTLKFCGRSYRQDEDGDNSHVHAQEYVENMSTYKVSRERGKDNNAPLTSSETKAFPRTTWSVAMVRQDHGLLPLVSMSASL